MTPAGDIVVGIGSANRLAAAAGSALGRPWESVATLQGALDFMSGNVVQSLLVVPGARFTIHDAQLLARQSVDSACPTGLVATWLGEGVAERQIAKLAQYRPTGAATDLIYSQYGFSPLARSTTSNLELTSGTDDRPAGRLRSGHRLVAATAHGTPVDTLIGDTFVCAARTKLPATTPPAWPCHPAGLCLEAHRAGGAPDCPPRLQPGAIPVDCAIWSTCSAIALSDSVVDADSSLLRGFVTSRWCRDIIGTYRANDTAFPLVLFAATLARAGWTLGNVCLHLNRASRCGGHGDVAWVLVGDPVRRLPGLTEMEPVGAGVDAGQTEQTIQPGEARVLACPRDDVVLLCEPISPPSVDPGQLLLLPFTGTGLALMYWAGPEPLVARVLAHRAHDLPVELDRALSVRTRRGAYVSLHYLLDAAKRHVGEAEVAGIQNLERTLAARSHTIWPYLPLGETLRQLSGVAEETRRRSVSETHQLSAALIDAVSVTRRLLTASPAALHLLQRMHMPWAQWTPREDSCPYCGSPLQSATYAVSESARTRVTVDCLRCGLVSDAPTALGPVQLEIDESRIATGSLRWRAVVPQQETDLCYYAGTAMFERLPWQVSAPASVESSWHRRQDGKMPLAGTVRILPETPPGPYVVLGIILAHGEPCFARRRVLLPAQ